MIIYPIIRLIIFEGIKQPWLDWIPRVYVDHVHPVILAQLGNRDFNFTATHQKKAEIRRKQAGNTLKAGVSRARWRPLVLHST